MERIPKETYTPEFRAEAVRWVEAELPSLGAVSGNEEGEARPNGQRVRLAGSLDLENHRL